MLDVECGCDDENDTSFGGGGGDGMSVLAVVEEVKYNDDFIVVSEARSRVVDSGHGSDHRARSSNSTGILVIIELDAAATTTSCWV